MIDYETISKYSLVCFDTEETVMHKHLMISIDWYGPYDLEGAKEAAKKDYDAGLYLELEPNSNDSVWAKEKDGTNKPEHNHWVGFPNRTAKGLRYEVLKAGK